MNKLVFLWMVLVGSQLAACAIGYQAHGSLSDVAGEMRGKGYPGNAQGGGRFALIDRDGRLQCDGQLSPPDVAGTPGACQGEAGRGVVRCSDGREIPVKWTAITCRSFEGSGEDNLGNRLVFRVDRKK